MPFKSYIADKWNTVKSVSAKVGGKLKSMGSTISDTWTNKIQPKLEETLGTDATDQAAAIGSTLAGEAAGWLAGKAVSKIPVVGGVLEPLARKYASKWLGRKIGLKISPGLEERAKTETALDKLVHEFPDSDGTIKESDIKSGRNRYDKRSLYAMVRKGRSGRVKLRAFGRPINIFTEGVTGRHVNKIMLNNGTFIRGPPASTNAAPSTNMIGGGNMG